MRILNFKNILQCCVVGLLMVSCSNDLLDSDSTQEAHSKEKFRKVNSWEDQVALLEQKMQRFHNFAVAQAQGYTVQAGSYVPNMGYHYLNPEYVDGEFDLLKPEILVYHPDENGNMIFGAAEYLIPLMDCDEENPSYPAPEGFMGNEDHWHVNCAAGGWTLHAWVGVENPDGVFNATNSQVPFSLD